MDNLSLDHPDHPSNELHNAAYPTSDYQPSNHPATAAAAAAGSSSSPTPQNSIGRTISNAARRVSGKFAELAVPSLATTTARDPGWQHDDVNVPGPSHLDTGLGPPPSYEQSQSQSRSRPNTSHQAGSSRSITAGTGNTPGSISPASPNTSISPSTPLRPPATTYQSVGRTDVERAEAVAPPATAAAAATAASALTSGDVRVESSAGNRSSSSAGLEGTKNKHSDWLKKRRRRKWWCIVLVGLVVFIVALCIGVYIGVKGIGKDEHHGGPPPDWEQKYKKPSRPWYTSNAASPTSTVYITVEPEATPFDIEFE